MRRLVKLGGAVPWMVAAVLGSASLAALDTLNAHVVGRLVAAITRGDLSELRRYAVLGTAFVLAYWLASFLRRFAAASFAHRTLARFRCAAAGRLGRGSPGALGARHSGDILSRLSSDLALVEQLLREDLPTFIARTFAAAMAAAYMIAQDWKLTLVALAPAGLMIAVARRLDGPLREQGKLAQEAIAQVNVASADAIAGAEVIRASLLRPYLLARFEAGLERWVAAGLRQGSQLGLLYATGMLLSLGPWIAVFSFGGYLVFQRNIDIGVLFTFVGLLSSLTFPLQEMPRLWGQIRARQAVVGRALALLDTPAERSGGEPATLGLDPVVALRHVTFTYPGRDGPALDDVSLQVHRGQHVALVGKSGSGKSTVVRLLLGDHSPQQGEVLVSGRPAEGLSLSSLRELFAVVDQDVFLFDTSVGENIRAGRLDASEEEMRDAAAIADVDELVRDRPEGYDTAVGEGGGQLSGGQRQRIAIARALVKGAPVLVLDEATSALDNQAERRILEAIRARYPHHTVLSIAHRLSPVRGADVIHLFDRGRIVASGTHDELVHDGRYAELYHPDEIATHG